jgi:hypothetical protein
MPVRELSRVTRDLGAFLNLEVALTRDGAASDRQVAGQDRFL